MLTDDRHFIQMADEKAANARLLGWLHRPFVVYLVSRSCCCNNCLPSSEIVVYLVFKNVLLQQLSTFF